MRAKSAALKMKYERVEKALAHKGYLMDTASQPPVPSAAMVNLFHKLLQ